VKIKLTLPDGQESDVDLDLGPTATRALLESARRQLTFFPGAGRKIIREAFVLRVSLVAQIFGPLGDGAEELLAEACGRPKGDRAFGPQTEMPFEWSPDELELVP
jgi:hypothetical protein